MLFLADGRIVDTMDDPTAERVLDRMKGFDGKGRKVVVAMLRTAWRNLRHHKLRLVLSGVAIILGVGFVVGTLIFTDTLNRTFTDLFAQTTSDVVVTPSEACDSGDFAGTMRLRCPVRCSTSVAVDGVA